MCKKTKISVQGHRSSLHLYNENNARQPAHHTVCIEERRNRITHAPATMITHAIQIILNVHIKQENNAFSTPCH
jgi:hypothetical protein